MRHDTLISATELQRLQAAGQALLLLDCSFDLADTDAGAGRFRRAHVPGAHYVHLERDLAGAKTGHNGRHPLPERGEFAARAARWGCRPGVQVVTMDAQGGPYAARAWWLLRWLGHAEVAVLDGGLAAWQAAGGALVASAESALPSVATTATEAGYAATAAAMPTIDADGLQAALAARSAPGLTLLDARAGERFRGEVETIDPVAGHIPGARLRFFKDNLQADGRFKPAALLRAEFAALGVGQGVVVNQCGSGVTACHNLLAIAHAGLGLSVLYPGSWSEWCSHPGRPVARGDGG